MLVQVNTDRHVDCHEALATQVRGVVAGALSRFSDHITRVEVHLSDASGKTSGPFDMRCLMEARLEGRQPLTVIHEGPTLEQAIDGAAERLTHVIVNTLGRLQDQRRQAMDPPSPDFDRTERA